MDIDAFGSELKERRIRSGSGVPCSYFTPVVNYMGSDPGLDYVPASSEGEAVAIAAGLVAGGRPAFALMQNSGLGNAVNPITSMLYIYQMPVVLLVSHRGEPGKPDEPQHERMGVITDELITLCGIEGYVFDETSFGRELDDVLARQVPAGWVFRKGRLTGGSVAAPITFEAETSAFALPPRRRHVPAMDRYDALQVIAPLLNAEADRPAVVATTGKLSRELYELDDQDHSKANRFYMVGSMGCAAGFGLGVARTRPGKVVVLDGDGALLMKLGTLATIGAAKSANLHHVVIDNAAHDSTGGQPTASPSVDFAAIALASGYRRADTVSTADELKQTLEAHLSEEGPTFLRVVVRTGGKAELGRPKLAPRDAYARFRDWLAETA
ncbi:MAG: phosphonopyruvate decarboxylase [Myxococcales bacterium]|nr:phosphonopyruvate decarboxylase [Myxococcales bacterium]